MKHYTFAIHDIEITVPATARVHALDKAIKIAAHDFFLDVDRTDLKLKKVKLIGGGE